MHCVDPRVLTMVSDAYTCVDRGQKRQFRVRIETTVKENQLDLGSKKFQTLSFELESIESKQEQIESMANQTQQSNPNPNPRDQRVRDLPGPRATPSPVRVTHLRRRSPDFAAQWSCLLAAPGRRGRVCGARKHGSVHGRLDGGALTLWRARAPASKPRRRRPARSARPPWPVAVTAAKSGERRGRKE